MPKLGRIKKKKALVLNGHDYNNGKISNVIEFRLKGRSQIIFVLVQEAYE